MNDRLKQILIENGETSEEAESLASLSRFLDKLPKPQARQLHRQKTLELLSAYLPHEKSRFERFSEWYPVALLFSQIRVIHYEIWLASAFVLSMGMIVTLFTSNLLLFSALAPMVTAVGVALLYDHDIVQMLEIEETTRTSSRVLLLARLTLVFGFNLTLALIGSIILAVIRSEISLLPLIMSWLAPMTFLSGLAFLCSVLLVDTLATSAFTLLLWMVHLILKSQASSNNLIHLLSMPGLSDMTNRPLVVLTGILLTVVGLWVAGLQRTQQSA